MCLNNLGLGKTEIYITKMTKTKEKKNRNNKDKWKKVRRTAERN